LALPALALAAATLINTNSTQQPQQQQGLIVGVPQLF
jgi:hypothetical protein